MAIHLVYVWGYYLTNFYYLAVGIQALKSFLRDPMTYENICLRTIQSRITEVAILDDQLLRSALEFIIARL